jgi:LmbE family N-acetylglucosaminyl deacetylase
LKNPTINIHLLMKILVIAAHPDDEVLGVGGTILKHIKEHDEVCVLIATVPYEPEWTKKYILEKQEQQKAVDAFLGIKKRYQLGLPTIKLNTIATGELNRKVGAVIDEIKPDVVYTHYEHDLNYDHTLIFNATLVGTRPPKRSRVICYETLSESEWNNKAFQPNIWVDIEPYIEKKIDAMRIYASEIKQYPHPRSPEGIRILAQKRGIEVALRYAEAFLLIRDVVLLN